MALPTCHLTEAIKQSSPLWAKNSTPSQSPSLDKEKCKNDALLEAHISKMQKIMTRLISLGRDLIWKPCCKALIKHQRILGIFKSDKHPSHLTFHHASIAVENVTISET